MAVDPCFRLLLQNPRMELRRPPPHVSLADIRHGNRAFLMSTHTLRIHEVSEDSVPGSAGIIPIRSYRPSGARDLPLILFFHGGGFVLGDLDTHDDICRKLAVHADAAVVAVDYRLAPEARFPASVEDCKSVLAWLGGNAIRLGIDPTRLALCGDSAGANLAIATAMSVLGGEFALRHLALLYPLVNPLCDTPSMQEFAKGFLLTKDAVRWFWESYLGAEGDLAHPLAALLLGNLEGLPTCSITTAEYDPLRDEGELLAHRLRASGVSVIARRYGGMIHGFAGMPGLTPVASRALSDIAADMRASWKAAP